MPEAGIWEEALPQKNVSTSTGHELVDTMLLCMFCGGPASYKLTGNLNAHATATGCGSNNI